MCSTHIYPHIDIYTCYVLTIYTFFSHCCFSCLLENHIIIYNTVKQLRITLSMMVDHHNASRCLLTDGIDELGH